jgi:hypothetical protein
MYLFTGDREKVPFNKASNKEIVKTLPEKPKPVLENPAEARPSENDTSAEKALIADNKLRRSASGSSRKVYAQPPSYENNSLPDIEQADMKELQPVSALQPISVSAPLLRDKRGNIIMDLGLISNPREPYIVVTGPNGKQTKISNKFLKCLSYINGSSSADTDLEGMECKSRFEEWRNKLLSEAAFIPTANNFFDIFEMKEMIQD